MPSPLLKARRRLAAVALAICVCLCADAATANSTDDAVARANRMAYELAMKCFVAYGTARGNEQDAGHASQASSYEAHARQSFGIATKLGDTLGYSGNRQNEDFGMAQARELPKFVKDAAYLRRTLSTCGAAGL